ncbi:MAG: hypothetical protein WEB63_05410 [Cucumibacter sp.]
MKIEVGHQAEIGAVVMRCVENCDTDSRPFVSELQFRHCPASFDAMTACVAAALVFSDFCGELIEFSGVSIGLDHRNAIEAIVPQASGIHPVDASKKDIRQGRDVLVVAEAGRLVRTPLRVAEFAQAARLITWSGDFIVAGAPDGASYVGGQVFTNAGLVAGDTAVSLAVGLLVGGRNARMLHVGRPDSLEKAIAARYREGLSSIGVNVEIH